MRVGLLGGTFDPVHLGHLVLADACREGARLDQVWFVPSFRPPHKIEVKITRFETRADFVELALAGQTQFKVERVEAELPVPSYTAQTLAELRARHPNHTFALILGEDSLAEFATWHMPQELARGAEIVAVPRPGFAEVGAADFAAALGLAESEVRLTRVAAPLIDISSRRLRADVAAGRSTRFRVPRAVEEVIRERKLYRAN